MIPYERRKQMLQQLEESELVTLEDFCEVLPGVSQSTVRRDLKTLEDEGHIVLLRGGAARLKKGLTDTPVNARSILHVKEKEIIAKCAAALVKDGEVIYLDSGSTPMRMVKHLRDKQITIVTTSATIFQEMEGRSAECIIVGGEINFNTGSIIGTLTNSLLKDIFFDKAFIGASGFSLQAGINTPDLRETQKKQIVKENSKEAFVLADHFKAGKTTMCKIFEMGEVTIICDQESELLTSSGNYIIAQ